MLLKEALKEIEKQKEYIVILEDKLKHGHFVEEKGSTEQEDVGGSNNLSNPLSSETDESERNALFKSSATATENIIANLHVGKKRSYVSFKRMYLLCIIRIDKNLCVGRGAFGRN